MRILRTLPYGNATFFAVRRIEDPIGLLPPRLILGINKRGVHFFRPVPKEYLHSAELRDIMQVCYFVTFVLLCELSQCGQNSGRCAA
jgi:hypothetical protein